MNATVIGVFGRINSGKSSLVNLLLGQDHSIVSRYPGTTTDPVKKRIEISGLGPCQLIDTAGLDDGGELGDKRAGKTREIASQVDMAILIYTANRFEEPEREILKELRQKEVPLVLVHNQSDIIPMDAPAAERISCKYGAAVLEFSCFYLDEEEEKTALQQLVQELGRLSSRVKREKPMFQGLLRASDDILLVCPVDDEAPLDRLILPQVKAIREILDGGAVATVLQPDALVNHLRRHPAPDLVVTDSQVFPFVAEHVPEPVPLTSFSILLARSKGCFEAYLEGTPAIDRLQDGDRILLLESCSHHSSCNDIGRVRLPALFRKYTGRNLDFEVVPGLENIGRPVDEYALVVQCGGCMVTPGQLYRRLHPAMGVNVPVTNYGLAIAFMTGIYERAVRPLLR